MAVENDREELGFFGGSLLDKIDGGWFSPANTSNSASNAAKIRDLYIGLVGPCVVVFLGELGGVSRHLGADILASLRA